MIYNILKKSFRKFNYELVHFAEMERMKRIINRKIGGIDLSKKRYNYDYFNGVFYVFSYVENVRIEVKSFRVKDYGSEEYALACAQELCDKLNEKP